MNRRPATKAEFSAAGGDRAGQSTTPFGAVHALWRAIGVLASGGARIARSWARMSNDAERFRDLSERLALPGSLAGLPSGGVWLHGASVGEIRALAPLVRALKTLRPEIPLVVTATTPTGRDRAAAETSAAVRLAPLDAPGAVARFLAATRPRLHVVVETEIWPTRLWALHLSGTPAALVSARLSPERAPRYRRLAWVYRPCLASLALVAPASEDDRVRLVALGANPARLAPVGNLKWDAAPTAPSPAEVEATQRALGIDSAVPWIVLGSVHPGEASPLIDAVEQRLGPRESVGWLVAPRHPDRFAPAAEQMAQRPGGLWRASAGPAPPGARAILLDQIGLLPKVYPLARGATLGGSFVPVGGHTPLEAAAAGRPLVAGPHVEHQLDLIGPLAETGALVRCRDSREAGAVLVRWLRDPGEADQAGAAARAEVQRRRGVAAHLAGRLVELLG